MLYNDYTATRETLPVLLRKGVWQTTDTKGECQKTDRESDSCVVPMILGNASEERQLHVVALARETLTTLSGRE